MRFPEWVAQQTEARLPNANHGGYGLLLILTAEALEIGRLSACFTGCQFTVVPSQVADLWAGHELLGWRHPASGNFAIDGHGEGSWDRINPGNHCWCDTTASC